MRRIVILVVVCAVGVIVLRATLDTAEAAVTAAQRTRIRRAADLWLARNERYQSHDLGFDILLLVGRRWPRYLPNAL